MNILSNETTISILHDLMRAKGWTQVEVANRLGITQGYLSRLLTKGHKPRYRLKSRIFLLIFEDYPIASLGSSDALSKRVMAAMERSAEFRNLVAAGLSLIQENE